MGVWMFSHMRADDGFTNEKKPRMNHVIMTVLFIRAAGSPNKIRG